MGKKRRNFKKDSIRFALVPGKDKDGNPVNLYKPI